MNRPHPLRTCLPQRQRLAAGAALALMATLFGCGGAFSDLPLKRVVIYRNGVAYFERSGQVSGDEVRFKMRGNQVGDFLATLAVMERGGSSVRSASFPLKMDDDLSKARRKKAVADGEEPSEDELRGLKTVALALDGKEHDLIVGYVAEAPVWRPTYRLVIREGGQADLQAWGIVQNLSGEDWQGVRLSLVAGAPLAFDPRLSVPVIPQRPVITDLGEFITAVPKGEVGLAPQEASAPATASGYAEASKDEDDKNGPAPPPPAPGARSDSRRYGAPTMTMTPSAPRSVAALASVAVQAGATRYDLPMPVTIPFRSATMVLMLATSVPGETLFMFAPDDGVSDSSKHPFRVARFSNKTAGLLEKGNIAVFGSGSFLGQGMLDPIPAGGVATVPFALDRAVAIDGSMAWDRAGGRVARIENGQLTIERDEVRRSTYRVKNGSNEAIRVLIKYARNTSFRLHAPPEGTEDNVGTGFALVPVQVKAKGDAELRVEERLTQKEIEDFFSARAADAVRLYLSHPKANPAVVAKLRAAWALRDEIVERRAKRYRFERETQVIRSHKEQMEKGLKAIEKTPGTDKLKRDLTRELSDAVTKLSELNRGAVENTAKLSELEVRWDRAIREVRIDEPLPHL